MSESTMKWYLTVGIVVLGFVLPHLWWRYRTRRMMHDETVDLKVYVEANQVTEETFRTAAISAGIQLQEVNIDGRSRVQIVAAKKVVRSILLLNQTLRSNASEVSRAAAIGAAASLVTAQFGNGESRSGSKAEPVVLLHAPSHRSLQELIASVERLKNGVLRIGGFMPWVHRTRGLTAVGRDVLELAVSFADATEDEELDDLNYVAVNRLEPLLKTNLRDIAGILPTLADLIQSKETSRDEVADALAALIVQEPQQFGKRRLQ